MRLAWGLAALTLSGCAGAIGGFVDSGSGGGTTGAGAGGGSGGGTVDSGTGGGGGAAGGGGGTSSDGGRYFSTNRLEFFGASRCSSASALFCDDFESRTAGQAPDPASWSLEYWNSAAASIAVDTAQAARGSNSVHFRVTAASPNKAMMVVKKVFPIPGNAFWLRMFMYVDTVPLPYVWNNTANFPLIHWTFASASGPYLFASGTKFPDVRAGGAINRVLLLNEDGMDKPEIGIDDTPPAGHAELPAKQWICMELYWSAPASEMRVIWDGVEHPKLHLTATNNGGNGAWPLPAFDQLLLGWTHYQAYNKTGTNFDLWVDEVAIDTERIGCSR